MIRQPIQRNDMKNYSLKKGLAARSFQPSKPEGEPACSQLMQAPAGYFYQETLLDMLLTRCACTNTPHLAHPAKSSRT